MGNRKRRKPKQNRPKRSKPAKQEAPKHDTHAAETTSDPTPSPQAASDPTPSPEVTSSQPAPEGKSELAKKTASGSAWTLVGYGGEQVLRLAGNLIVARLVAPDVFGLMALVQIFIQGLQMFSDLGIGLSVIQHKKGEDELFLRTAWTVQTLRGVAIWLCACLIAWPISSFYGDERLLLLIPVAALTALFDGFDSITMFTLNRQLMLARITLLQIVARGTGVVVMVVWAWYSPTVWAMVAAGLFNSVAKLVLSHTWLPKFKHRFEMDAKAWESLFRFGKWIFISTVLHFLSRQTDRLMLGKFIEMSTLGVYSIALMWALMPVEALFKLGHKVMVPVFSRLIRDGGDLASGFKRIDWVVLLIGGFIVASLVSCGDNLIKILYPGKFHEAGWMLQILVVGCGFQVMQLTYGCAIVSQGASKYLVLFNFTKWVSLITLVPLGFYNFGLVGVVCGLAMADVAQYIMVQVGGYRRGLPWPSRDMLCVTYVVFCVLVSNFVGSMLPAMSDDYDLEMTALNEHAAMPGAGERKATVFVALIEDKLYFRMFNETGTLELIGDFDDYELELKSLDAASAIPNTSERQSTVFVALVGDELHFRAFNADGEIERINDADTQVRPATESRLMSDLAALIRTNTELNDRQKQKRIRKITSSLGYTQTDTKVLDASKMGLIADLADSIRNDAPLTEKQTAATVNEITAFLGYTWYELLAGVARVGVIGVLWLPLTLLILTTAIKVRLPGLAKR